MIGGLNIGRIFSVLDDQGCTVNDVMDPPIEVKYEGRTLIITAAGFTGDAVELQAEDK